MFGVSLKPSTGVAKSEWAFPQTHVPIQDFFGVILINSYAPVV